MSWAVEIKAANGIIRRARKGKKSRASDRTGYYGIVPALIERFETETQRVGQGVSRSTGKAAAFLPFSLARREIWPASYASFERDEA